MNAVLKKIAKSRIFSLVLMGSFIGLFATSGYLLLTGSNAAPQNTSNYTSSDEECGNRVENYSYDVPFGDAVWNQPVCDLPRYDKSAEYAERFYKWSTVNDGSPEQAHSRGRLGLGLDFPKPTPFDPDGTRNIWSRNVYLASDATTTTKVMSARWGSNLDTTKWHDPSNPFNIRAMPNNPIPWNPDWLTGQAGDNEIVILDESNGRIYEIWGYWKTDFDRYAKCGPLLPEDRICTMSTQIGRDIDGNIIDYRTFEGLHGDRGVGFSKMITFTRPQEILAGEIKHALGVSMPNTMYGPPCTKSQQGTDAEGNTCGIALAPASKLEHGDKTIPNYLSSPYDQLYTLDKTVPEGTRFALDMSIQEIDSWINSQERFNNNPKLANTARIVATALKDYGFIVVDTSGYGAGIQVSGAENPKDKALWNQLGFHENSDGSKLLRGLIQEDNLYVIEPPTVTCDDGSKSKYYCKWSEASYATSDTPPQPPNYEARSDINEDGSVGLIDISILLGNWRDKWLPNQYPRADVNRDGSVGLVDLSIVMDYWTSGN